MLLGAREQCKSTAGRLALRVLSVAEREREFESVVIDREREFESQSLFFTVFPKRKEDVYA